MVQIDPMHGSTELRHLSAVSYMAPQAGGGFCCTHINIAFGAMLHGHNPDISNGRRHDGNTRDSDDCMQTMESNREARQRESKAMTGGAIRGTNKVIGATVRWDAQRPNVLNRATRQ